MAVVNPERTGNRTMMLAAAVCGALLVAVILLWGPVARGLHEQSIERWCRWSPAVEADPGGRGDARDVQIAECVERALTDPEFMTALRASL